MPRVKVAPALPDARTLDVEIARLRDLDIGALQVRWQNVFRRRPPPHLPRHLLFRVLPTDLEIADVEIAQARDLDIQRPRIQQRRTDLDARHAGQAGRRLDCLPVSLAPPP